ncbi:MAG: DUF2845 domain-containing protein [Gammaproteobacteria bacterium]|nr:DUF2845 domain-containing protein [Gammaproteobacteria bacterium]
MHNRLGRWMLMTALTLSGAATATADSIRCGSYLVNTGDSRSRVLQVCGEPQYAWQDGFIEESVRRHEGYSNPSPLLQPYTRLPNNQETEVRRVIPVYKWEYHLGRGTFLKTLVFHGDILIRILDGPRQ